MAEIILIAAIADNGVIGQNNTIPWHISADLKRFKRLTTGHTVIMGHKTWESLPVQPLPGRQNIVLSHRQHTSIEGCRFHTSLESALADCRHRKQAFLIGGASVYSAGLKIADTLEITHVHDSPQGDTFFPAIDWAAWSLTRTQSHDGFTFHTYTRKTRSNTIQL